MAIVRACYVVCDICGDPGPVECFEGAEGARRLARVAGFTYGNGKDICFKCRATPRSDLSGGGGTGTEEDR